MQKNKNQKKIKTLMKFSHDDVIGIFGMRGCGKSYLCKKVQLAFPRLFIFDVLQEYPDSEDFENDPIYNFDDFCKFIERSVELKSFKKIIRFDIDNAQKSVVFEQMIRLIYLRGNCTIVIEEIQSYCTPHYIDHYMEHLFLTGRHQAVSVIYTTQKPSTVNKKILSQSTKVFSGVLPTKNDVTELMQQYGEDAKKLSSFEKREFLYWQVGQKSMHYLNTNNLTEKKK